MKVADLWARVRGEWIRHSWYLRSFGRVCIGPGLRAYGPLQVIGQGRVCIGRDVTIGRDPFGSRTVSLQTQGSREAAIEVGDRVTLLGTHISCGRHVSIGRGSWIEDARIMDSDFHRTEPGAERHKLSVDSAAEVSLGERVCVAGRAMILKGVKIGAGACVRPGAVLLREVPAGSLVSGFPARAERAAAPCAEVAQKPSS